MIGGRHDASMTAHDAFCRLGCCWRCAGRGPIGRRFLSRQDHYHGGRHLARRRLRPAHAHGRRAISASTFPGNPTVVATNMPGAGQMLVANWLANVAPKTAPRSWSRSRRTWRCTRRPAPPASSYDVRKFHWIGNTTDTPNVINSWHTTGIQHHPGRDDSASWSSARPAPPAAPSSILMRSISWSAPSSRSSPAIPAATTSTSPWSAARSAAAAPIPGQSWKSTRPQWLAEKKIIILVQVGAEAESGAADVPTHAGARQERRRPPGARRSSRPTPRSRGRWSPMRACRPSGVEALRRAFDATMKDPEFLAEAAKIEDRHQPDDRRGSAEDRGRDHQYASRRARRAPTR